MAFTHTTGVTYTTDAGRLASTTTVKSADTQLGIADTIGANGGVTHFLISVDVSEIESCCLYSDKDVTVYVNANNNSVLQIDLVAGVMVTWNTDLTSSNPLGTTDWTGCYVHNDTTAVATVKFQFLVNQPSGS
jgi:hypothetical protein